MSKHESCQTCFYARQNPLNQFQCHRNAPQPVNYSLFDFRQLLRDIARSLRESANTEDPGGRVMIEDECPFDAVWPEVEPDEWCGDWRERTLADDPIRKQHLIMDAKRLPTRTMIALRNGGISTFEQLCDYTEGELFSLPDMGRLGLQRLQMELAELGLELKP
jgi:hypothetical protein